SLGIFTHVALHNRSILHFLSGSKKLFLREVFTFVYDSRSLSGYIRTYVFVRSLSLYSRREMYSPELNSDFSSISMTQNDLQELKEVWDQWDDETNQLFYCNNDLVPTVEEYTTLLHCSRIQADKAYSRAANALNFLKNLMSITGMSKQWVATQIKQKRDNKCISWKSLRDLILANPDMKERVDVFALCIYGLVIFPKALGHIDEAVSDLFDRLEKRVTSIPVILAETFRSLSACRRTGEGIFLGCAQLLLPWFYNHFWKVERVFYQLFSENYSLLKEFIATPRRDNISEEKWMAILQSPRLRPRMESPLDNL
ncbi:hypothetical protein Golax_025944, partial [Gossypium laxum]|nr:hypothetical protein [Gossypium laxum]